MTLDFILSYNNNEGVLTFPVIPNGGVTLSRGQKNETFDGVKGDMASLGNVGLCSFEISSIFPNRAYSWMRTGASSDGWSYVNTIEAVRKRRIPFRAILIDNKGGTVFNLPVSVDDFAYGLDEAGDISYSLKCTEYRFASTDTMESASADKAQTTADVQAQTESQKQASQGTSSGGVYTKLYTSDDAVMMAKTMYNEARGISSKTEIACIGWTILNRVDAKMTGNSIYAVITYPNQFAYSAGAKTVSDYGYDLVALATDVLDRWSRERAGQTDVGRVLPVGYLWYAGDGSHNYFRNAYRGGTRWDYSLPSPYDS